MRYLFVVGRRYRQRYTGNVYCTATVYIDGKKAFTTAMEYGYGSYYLQAAMDHLEARNMLPVPRLKDSVWGDEQIKEYCDRCQIIFNTEVADVAKEKDLRS